MQLKIVSHLGLLAGFVAAFEHYQHFVGGELQIVQPFDPMQPQRDDLDYEHAVEVRREGYSPRPNTHLSLMRMAVLFLNHTESQQPRHLLRFYMGPPEGSLTWTLSEELLMPEEYVSLETQLEIGRYLAAVSYSWVTDSHMRGEGSVAAHVQKLLGSEGKQLTIL